MPETRDSRQTKAKVAVLSVAMVVIAAWDVQAAAMDQKRSLTQAKSYIREEAMWSLPLAVTVTPTVQPRER